VWCDNTQFNQSIEHLFELFGNIAEEYPDEDLGNANDDPELGSSIVLPHDPNQDPDEYEEHLIYLETR